jgi:hypothetical protein
VELESEWGENLLVEVPQDRYRHLNISRGDEVHVSPRDMNVYVDDYSI